MTAYGPPSNPNQPPPPGGYGAPPVASGGAKVSPSAVNPLDWAIAAAALLALVFSFFSYYSYSINRGAVAKALGAPVAEFDRLCSNLSQVPAGERAGADKFCNGATVSAWHGFFGWFGVVLVVLGAVIVVLTVLAAQVRLPFPARLVALALLSLGFVSTLIALFVVPATGSGTEDGVSYDKVVEQGHGFSYWIVLVLCLAGAALAFLRFQQTGGSLPSRGGSGGAPAQPGYGPPAGGGYGPPPQQYGQQSPPQSPPQGQPQYPPQGPPPGYQQGPPQGYQPPPQSPPQGYQQPPPPGYSPPSQ